MATGRTSSKWVDVIVHDSGGTLRSIPVDSVNGVGLVFEEHDVTAFQDAVRNVLPGHADLTIEITGPFDTSALAAAGTLSGSHTVLKDIVGGNTPLSLDIQIGIGAAWSSGDPQFGIDAVQRHVQGDRRDGPGLGYGCRIVTEM
jgi:hypothetical protein